MCLYSVSSSWQARLDFCWPLVKQISQGSSSVGPSRWVTKSFERRRWAASAACSTPLIRGQCSNYHDKTTLFGSGMETTRCWGWHGRVFLMDARIILHIGSSDTCVESRWTRQQMPIWLGNSFQRKPCLKRKNNRLVRWRSSILLCLVVQRDPINLYR